MGRPLPDGSAASCERLLGRQVASMGPGRLALFPIWRQDRPEHNTESGFVQVPEVAGVHGAIPIVSLRMAAQGAAHAAVHKIG